MRYVIVKALLIGCIVLIGMSMAQAAALVPSHRPITSYQGVVFIGDSITAAWPIAIDFPGAINRGIGGQTSCQMRARFAQDVIALRPGVVVILAGANDIRYYADTSTACLFDMVQMAQAARIGVIVGTLAANEGWAPGTPASYGEALYGLWNTAVWLGSQVYGYWVADYFDATRLNGKQNAALFGPDKTHPNAAGYVVMTDVLRPVIAALRQRQAECGHGIHFFITEQEAKDY